MKRLVVLGGGESGVGTALLGKEKGFEVFVSDYGKLKEEYKDVLIHNEIEWEEGTHTSSKILNADVVMKSPGISEQVPIVKALVEQGVRFWIVGILLAILTIVTPLVVQHSYEGKKKGLKYLFLEN